MEKQYPQHVVQISKSLLEVVLERNSFLEFALQPLRHESFASNFYEIKFKRMQLVHCRTISRKYL